MTKFQYVMSRKPQDLDYDTIVEVLKSIPLKEFAWWKSIFGDPKKIMKIKELREKYDLPLKSAKQIIDAVYDGATLRAAPEEPVATPEYSDAIEAVERALEHAARIANQTNQHKAVALLITTKQQVHELWMEQFDVSDPAQAPE